MTQEPSLKYVGSTAMQIRDGGTDISFNVLVQYPTDEPSTPTAFGPYIMDVSVDAPICSGRFPLILISHGSGGSHLLYRTISMHLVKNKFIVAMVEHSGNNRNDNRLENSVDNLILRPKHLSVTIDRLLSDKFFDGHVANDKIAVIGHSMGGYTALALAGGIPRTKEGKTVDVAADPRVKAIVLLAPGTGWYQNSLSCVTMPILMLTAEHDPVTSAWNADIVLEGAPHPSQVTFRQVQNAGHFSFLSPFPQSMTHPNFPPSTDPYGFDRGAFHIQLPSDILDFLNEKFRQ